jgi:hypothetical protein
MRALLVVILALCVAGCSLTGDGGGSVETAELERVVVQPEDLPRGFIPFDVGEATSDTTSSGREGGWKARYRRPGTAQTAGPLVVASLVDAFESSDGARDDYRAATDVGSTPEAWERVEVPQLGEESSAVRLEQGSAASRVAFFRVVWREKNVVASLELNGFAGRVGLADAVELARKQAARIARAAES